MGIKYIVEDLHVKGYASDGSVIYGSKIIGELGERLQQKHNESLRRKNEKVFLRDRQSPNSR